MLPCFRVLGASFPRFGCSVFEFWVLCFRDLGAPLSSFGCFVFEIWVLRASVFVFECFVFETTVTKHVLLADKFIPYRPRPLSFNSLLVTAMKCIYVGFSLSKLQSFF